MGIEFSFKDARIFGPIKGNNEIPLEDELKSIRNWDGFFFRVNLGGPSQEIFDVSGTLSGEVFNTEWAPRHVTLSEYFADLIPQLPEFDGHFERFGNIPSNKQGHAYFWVEVLNCPGGTFDLNLEIQYWLQQESSRREYEDKEPQKTSISFPISVLSSPFYGPPPEEENPWGRWMVGSLELRMSLALYRGSHPEKPPKKPLPGGGGGASSLTPPWSGYSMHQAEWAGLGAHPEEYMQEHKNKNGEQCG
ncbi:MAG: hypothetical protein ACFFER_12830 [Candidatus Thorarchaeota archaeon]